MANVTQELIDTLERGLRDSLQRLGNLRVYQFSAPDLEREMLAIDGELARLANILQDGRHVLTRIAAATETLNRRVTQEGKQAEATFAVLSATLAELTKKVGEEIASWRKRPQR